MLHARRSAGTHDELLHLHATPCPRSQSIHDRGPHLHHSPCAGTDLHLPCHAPWAEDLGHTGAPFDFDPVRRAQLRAELDAFFARKYGLSRDELRYILDPADTHGDSYPSETFRGLKRNEIEKFGEYRTRRLVLTAFDRLTGA